MPREASNVTAESAKQLMFAAVAEQLGAKTRASAEAAGITYPALCGMKQDHKGFLRGCRSAAKKLIEHLEERGIWDGEILVEKQHGYSTRQISTIFHAVISLVVAERIPEYKAAARLEYSSAYFRLKKTHGPLYVRACEDFGLHCPPNAGRVPDTLSARATMKLAAILVNLQFCRKYVSEVLRKKAGWLYGATERYGPYWQWLLRQSPGLPDGHLLQMTIWNEKTGKVVGHSPPENRSKYDAMRKAFQPNPIRSRIATQLREKGEIGFKKKSDAGSVILQGPGQPVLVRGKQKPVLSQARYAVIAALIDAGDKGLTKDGLEQESGRGGARKVLRQLANSDPDWSAVISFPGKTGGGYRLI